MQYKADENFIYINGASDNDLGNLSGVKLKKHHRFPKNIHAYREIVKLIPELKEYTQFIDDGKFEAAKLEETLILKRTKADIEGLRPYQAQDVRFLVHNGSTLVFNEPRTGKTPTMIKTMVSIAPKSIMIVTPASLVYNWEKEIQVWGEDCLTTFVYSGTPRQKLKVLNEYIESKARTKVLILSKESLKTSKVIQDIAFTVAIVDEAHFLRNWKTAQSKAIFNIKARLRYALTGTPAVKHGSDVFGMMHFLNPKAFPSYWQFTDRYWDIDDGHWGKTIGGVKKYREQELKDLMEVNSVQRKRTDVMQWLPKAQLQTIPIKLETKHVKLYDQMVSTYVASDGDVEVDTMNKLSQLMRLRQLCLDPRLLGFDVVGAKSKALLEFAEDNKEPFIVMTTFSSYFKIIKPELEKLGKKVGIIDGSISQKEKFKTAEKFQQGGFDILLCNIIAAGTGFTLDRADTIVFLDKDFNPSNNEQAQDRIVPTTQSRYHNINIISLVAAGTVDERINDILDTKQDLTKIINKRELL